MRWLLAATMQSNQRRGTISRRSSGAFVSICRVGPHSPNGDYLPGLAKWFPLLGAAGEASVNNESLQDGVRGSGNSNAPGTGSRRDDNRASPLNFVGMCLDIGHANLCSATRNDYLRFLDELNSTIPLIHLHLHENWGDTDSHLTLFTGPAAQNDTGICGLVRRLKHRSFSGSAILEQWPQPASLLDQARERLLKVWNREKDSRDFGTSMPSEKSSTKVLSSKLETKKKSKARNSNLEDLPTPAA